LKILKIKEKLKKLSKKTGRSYNDLALELAMESLVVRLIKNQYLNKNLVFKGGFVIYKAMKSNRFTRDVDSLSFTNNVPKLKENLEKAILAKTINDFNFYDLSYEDLHHIEGYEGLRCSIRFNLSEKVKDFKKGQKLHLDIGFGDPISSKIIKTKLNTLIIDKQTKWNIYPIENIISEKLEALIKRGDLSSRAKDIYDLSLLLPKIENIKLLKKAIKDTFSKRKTKIPTSFYNTISNINTKILETSWGTIDLIGKNVDFNKTWLNFLSELEKLKL
jgi:predicted nucleotidyltransferase component of viral defense system